MAYYNFKRVIAKVVYTGGGNLDGLIDGSISGELTSEVTKVRDYAFYNCNDITRVRLPYATDIGNNAFTDCDNLEEIIVPKAEIIRMYAFSNLYLGFNLILPNVTTIYSYAFLACQNLGGGTMVFDFTGCIFIPTLKHTNAFDMISNYEIWVPSALYDMWVNGTNWSAIADHIVAY